MQDDLPCHRPARADRPHHPDRGRIRLRQGARRPRPARLRQPQGGPLRRRQRRGDSEGPGRERAVRPRARRLHRGAPEAVRALRPGRGRHALPRRDRRHAARGADPPAARPPGGPLHAGRRPRRDLDRRAHRRRDPPRPGRTDR